MKAFDPVAVDIRILSLLCFRADAHDSAMAHHECFPTRRKWTARRDSAEASVVPWKSCCDNGTMLFKTSFRVGG